MIKIEKNLSKIKGSNLICLIQKQSDIEEFQDLILEKFDTEEKISEKIKEILKKWENTSFDFFVWQDGFENITVIFYLNKEKKDFIYFASDIFRNYKNSNFTIYSRDEKMLLNMLDISVLSRYKYTDFKTDEESKKKDKINILLNKENIGEKAINARISTLENIVLARDLWSMPSNELYPESFVKIVEKTKFKNTKIEVFDYKKIEKIWLNLLKAVWKWSKHKPSLIILKNIVNKKLPTIWIVWKWVTFDTWWIQVKPWDSMYEMKWDMCWAAQVFSLMKELDDKKLNVNIIACLVLAENHISWESFKPSDIIKSYSWKTVDIVHTDAEWRLILADWVSYISKNYKLDKILTIATLTWACIVWLWFRHAWIMWTDNDLINKFIKYSEDNFEKYNRLPFDDYFIEKTKWEVADLQNLSKWVYAWSTMWGAFIYNFLSREEEYTHIDIAWTALNSYEAYGLANKWMTWFWVDSMSKIIQGL